VEPWTADRWSPWRGPAQTSCIVDVKEVQLHNNIMQVNEAPTSPPIKILT
jgi:hypothetical protein